MGRIGLVFPGQGSQFVGMGGDLCERHETFRNVFARTREILGTDILSLCLNGPGEALDRTVNTQLAVLTFEIAAFETLRELNVVTPAVVAGHSLGEYSAIYASGALGLEEVLTLVRSRAKRHEEAVPQGFGAMAKNSLQDGALTELQKELISLAIAVSQRCDACIGFHIKALIRLGATRAQIMETLGVCTYMGGGPALMYAAEAVRAYEEMLPASA
jgi:AhpD family alkylhydroperoxidase